MGEPKIENPENEYSFEDGLERALTEVSDLLKRQEYVVVAITGSSHDVGKSTLQAELGNRLLQTGADVEGYSEIENLGYASLHFSDAAAGKVIIFGAEPTVYSEKGKQNQDKHLAGVAGQQGLTIPKIDLRILIYRPDHPFTGEEKVCADIIIRNDRAIDDPRKMREE